MHLGLNRASLLYVVVCAIFTVGIWAILDLGSARLTAPKDIAGRWTPADAQIPQDEGFSISQSGRFVRFTLEKSNQYFDVILAKTSSETTDNQGQSLTFNGDGWHVEAITSPTSDAINFTFHAPPGALAPPPGTYRPEPMSPPSAPEQNTHH